MRLIDADAFKYWLLNRFAKSQDTLVLTLQGFIAEQPTAYDIDKVVDELEKASKDVSRGYLGKDNNKYHKHYKAVKLNRAIEIVKQGGVSDDVCKWKIDGVYLRSPHNIPFVTCIADDEDYRYNYCPVCGKKIKAVK